MNKNLQNGFILGAALQGKTEAYLPSGKNIGDLLVWNGTEWKAGRQIRLPSEFQEVEYIESTGTQYIDTEFQVKNDTSIYIDFMPVNSHEWAYPRVFGAYFPDTNNYYLSVRNDNGDCIFTDFPFVETDYQCDNLRIKLKHQLYYEPKFYVNNQEFSFETVYFSYSSYSAFVFGANSGGSLFRPCPMRLYELKLSRYVSNMYIEAKHFIPCYRKSDNEIGLYDILNDIFYTNSGTGTFIKGEDV